MQIKKAEVANFRKLKNVTIDLDDSVTLIVGRNNSGKTSLSEVFNKFLGPNNPGFTFDDFSFSVLSDYNDALNLYEEYLKLHAQGEEKEDESKIKLQEAKTKIPSIILNIYIEYGEQDDDSLGGFSELNLNLDDSRRDISVSCRYCIIEGEKFLSTLRDQRIQNKDIQITQIVENIYSDFYTKAYFAFDKENPDIIEKNIRIIPKYGRWDDLYALFDTPLEGKVVNLFKMQIQKDLNSNKPSNLGKWLKSENSSSKESRALGHKTRILLNYSSKEYRKLLSTLRRKLNLVESFLTSKQYQKINYESLSKIALTKYKKAFLRNDNEKYNLYFKNEHYSKNFLPNKIISYLNDGMDLERLNKKIERYLFDIIIKDAKILEDSLIINGLKDDENNDAKSLLLFVIVLYKKIHFGM